MHSNGTSINGTGHNNFCNGRLVNQLTLGFCCISYAPSWGYNESPGKSFPSSFAAPRIRFVFRGCECHDSLSTAYNSVIGNAGKSALVSRLSVGCHHKTASVKSLFGPPPKADNPASGVPAAHASNALALASLLLSVAPRRCQALLGSGQETGPQISWAPCWCQLGQGASSTALGQAAGDR